MKFLVIIHDIDEFDYTVEADDEQAAIAEAEKLWALDGGPQRDFHRIMPHKQEV